MIEIKPTRDGRQWNIWVNGIVRFTGHLFEVMHTRWAAEWRQQS